MDALVPLSFPTTIITRLPAPTVSERHASARLPVELWRQIFIHATHVPGGYDTSYVSPFEESEISNGYSVFLRKLKENHRTKQILCLVSKTWRALAQELIFEYLFLQDAYDWARLAQALEDSKRNDVRRRGHGVGWYVKRIEIQTRCWTEELGAAAARVIRCCPNLRVLAVGALEETGGVPAEMIRAVFETCPRAIRSLDWTCDIGPSQTADMFCYIQKAVKLQSLFLCVQQDLLFDDADRLVESGIRTILPELHTIELVSPDFDPSDVLLVMSSWKLPALRQLILCGQDELKRGFHFFRAHGAKLTTLEFDYAGESDSPVQATELPQQGPEMLFTHCPNLTELILQVHWAASQAGHGHPKIERIGLRGLHLPHVSIHSRNRGGALALRQEHDAEQRAILQGLKTALPVIVDRARFPSVKVVRLLDFDQTRFRKVPWRASGVTFWALWVRRFERLGIRLEDHAGDLIELVFKEMNVLLPEDEQAIANAARPSDD